MHRLDWTEQCVWKETDHPPSSHNTWSGTSLKELNHIQLWWWQLEPDTYLTHLSCVHPSQHPLHWTWGRWYQGRLWWESLRRLSGILLSNIEQQLLPCDSLLWSKCDLVEVVKSSRLRGTHINSGSRTHMRTCRTVFQMIGLSTAKTRLHWDIFH